MLNLPSRDECFSLLEEYQVPEHIMNHCLQVNKVAVLIAQKLVNVGVDINVELVDRASLLHDIDKMLTLKSRKHGQMSKQIITDKGYPEVGRVVANHTLNSVLKDLDWESKVLNYADVRVLHDKIISMPNRLSEFEERFSFEMVPHIKQKYYELEDEIFSKVDINPEDVK